MSKSDVDRDGFKIVSKRNSRKKPTKIPSNIGKFVKKDESIDILQSTTKIHSAVEELSNSEYFAKVLQTVSTVTSNKSVVELVCFGLGHIGECHISRYQLALVLCLKDSLNISKVLVHDPIFYKDECTILTDLGLKVIEENSEGIFSINADSSTIVYFPHCPKQLTNNFLWSNWGLQLENCILICNSFLSLIDNQPSRIVEETAPFIYKIYPHTSEIPLDNTFKHTDIFNDTSVHCFPKLKLETIDSSFWIKSDKPAYQDTEEFITSQMVEKLNL